jgi:hypothetical protein
LEIEPEKVSLQDLAHEWDSRYLLLLQLKDEEFGTKAVHAAGYNKQIATEYY